jgi:hypothetical protein
MIAQLVRHMIYYIALPAAAICATLFPRQLRVSAPFSAQVFFARASDRTTAADKRKQGGWWIIRELPILFWWRFLVIWICPGHDEGFWIHCQ